MATDLTPKEETSSYPRRGYAWYMVILLTIAYVFSFIDRYIISLVIEPLKADLSLSDTQIGLLMGTAFALFYAIMGLPLGWLADRGRRARLVGAGVALWSLATAASGLARSFGSLFLARIGVGVGEATLAPCALSLISDSFPEKERGRPIAFYTAAQSFGAGLAFVGGGSVLAWANSIPDLALPLIGPVAPWQFTFIIVGLPGLLVAIPLWLLREPLRKEQAGLDQQRSMGNTLAYIRQRRATFGCFIAFPCVMTIVAYSQTWFPVMFMRTWQWDITQFALYFGIALLTVGPITVNVTGWICDRWYASGQHDAPMRIILIGSFLLVPSSALVPLMPSGELAFALLVLNIASHSIVSAAAPIALLNITPGEIRGQMSAIFYMIIAPVGLIVGPAMIGILNDSVFGEGGIRYSAAVIPLLFGLPVLALAGVASRKYREAYAARHPQH